MQHFWFGVIALLWAGFVVLEGFTFGVGTLLPIVGRTDARRRDIVQTIAPSWDGNEAWLLAAGAATFFAFRGWFDGLMTGFTAWFVSIFIALILRAASLSGRAKARTARGRGICDAIIFASSIGPAFVLGLLLANFLRGVELDGGGSVRSQFLSIFSGYALLGAAALVLLCAFQGASYLSMHTRGDNHNAARLAMLVTGPLAAASVVAWVSWTEATRGGVLSRVLAAAVTFGVLVALARAFVGHTFRAFAATALTSLVLPLWVFSALWPDVLPARNFAPLSLTVKNTAASSGAMTVLTIVGVEVGAVVLVYLTWSYWIFHARVTGKNRADLTRTEVARMRGPTSEGRWPAAAASMPTRLIRPVPELTREPSPSEA